METAYIKTPLGYLKIKGDAEGVQEVGFTDQNNTSSSTPKVLKATVQQLQEYFDGQRTQFNIPLNPQGSDFQKKAWKVLSEIPFGKTRSYQEVANILGNPKVIRAAANANGKNPIAIIIPCHRVIGSNGSLTGYAGGLQRKKWLLAHESPIKQGELF